MRTVRSKHLNFSLLFGPNFRQYSPSILIKEQKATLQVDLVHSQRNDNLILHVIHTVDLTILARRRRRHRRVLIIFFSLLKISISLEAN